MVRLKKSRPFQINEDIYKYKNSVDIDRLKWNHQKKESWHLVNIRRHPHGVLMMLLRKVYLLKFHNQSYAIGIHSSFHIIHCHWYFDDSLIYATDLLCSWYFCKTNVVFQTLEGLQISIHNCSHILKTSDVKKSRLYLIKHERKKDLFRQGRQG